MAGEKSGCVMRIWITYLQEFKVWKQKTAKGYDQIKIVTDCFVLHKIESIR